MALLVLLPPPARALLVRPNLFHLPPTGERTEEDIARVLGAT